MANSFVRYTGDGNTATYSIPFSYRVAGDLTVTLNAVATTAFSFNAAGTTITFNSPPANLTAIEIRRTTSQTTRLTDYASGSVLTESDLDTDSTQSFFMSQEAIDDAADKIKIDPADFQWDATSKRIKNVAAPTADTDAVNRAFISTNIPNITTVSGIASDVTTVAGISANVTTVAGNDANVTTVAGSIANVNTVATNIADVTTVANDLNEAISEIETAANDLNEATSEIDTVATNIANVNTVGTAIANVNTVAGINSDVTTVAGISANVTSVAGNSSNINAVAGNSTNINAVAADAADIGTVAGISSDVTAVAGNNTNITAVAGNSTNINAVNSNSANINTVAGANSNITTLAGINSNITTVAGISSDVTAVAGDATDIGAVAAKATEIGLLGTADAVSDMNTLGTAQNVTNMNTLAGISANITTAATNNANITTVAGDIANVNSVAGNAANINSVANIIGGTQTFVVTVAGGVFVIDGVSNPALTLIKGFTYTFDVSDNTVSGHPLAFKDSGGSAFTNGVTVNGSAGTAGATVVIAVPSSGTQPALYYCTTHGNAMGNTITTANNEVAIVAANISDVSTTAGSITNVNNVGGSIANVNTVASNISGVNSFADRYRVGASDPSSSLDAGDLAFNTTANVLKYYDGASWQQIVAGSLTDIVQDGSPQLGGGLDLNGNDITGTGNINITGGVTMSGDLTVNGTTTTINSTTMTVDDLNMVLASGAADSSAADGAGITIDGASATLTYTHAGTKWNVNKDFDVTGNIIVSGTVDGVDIAARDAVLTSTTTTATNANTTATAALPKSGGTMTGNIVFDAGQPTGNSALVPAAGTSGHFLAHNGAFAQVAYANVSGTPSLATVATSGAYSDLSGTPTIPSAVGGATGVDFNDDVKARFGTGNDLEIYHDGNDSYIHDGGTGTLIIRGSTAVRITNTGGDNMFQGTDGGDAKLYHAGSEKLATGSGGVDITGTATATEFDGLLSTGTAFKTGAWYSDNGGNGTQSQRFYFYNNGTTILHSADAWLFQNNNATKFTIDSSGNATAVGNVTAYSDERLKSDIKTIDNALDKVSQMRGVTFTKDDKQSSGVIAQEIEKVAPELVIDGEYKSVAYGNTVGYLIEAIKELKADLDNHKKHCTCGDSQ